MAKRIGNALKFGKTQEYKNNRQEENKNKNEFSHTG